MEGDIDIFVDGIDFEDLVVVSGNLRNGWFLNALSALAQNTALIERLFITK